MGIPYFFLSFMLWEGIPDIEGVACVLDSVFMDLDYVVRLYQLTHHAELNGANNKVRICEVSCRNLLQSTLWLIKSM